MYWDDHICVCASLVSTNRGKARRGRSWERLVVPKLLQPWFPYHTTSNTISTPFQAPPSPPLTFLHTILPHIKVLVNQSSPSSPGGRASANSASAPSSPPYRSSGLLVPIPLLWATRRLGVRLKGSFTIHACSILPVYIHNR